MCNQQFGGKKPRFCVKGTWSSSVTLAGHTWHQYNLCFTRTFLKAPTSCKLCLHSLMVLVSRRTQVHTDTWVSWKLLHSKQTLDSNSWNILHVIQVASLTKRRGGGEKGKRIYLASHLLTYCLISLFKRTAFHPTTWILCSSLAKEGAVKPWDGLGWQGDLSLAVKLGVTGKDWLRMASRSETVNLSFQTCWTEENSPTFSEVWWGQKGFQVLWVPWQKTVIEWEAALFVEAHLHMWELNFVAEELLSLNQ